MDMELFSKRLMELLGSKSRFKLAKDINIPHQTINRYIACKQKPYIDILIKLADYFDVSIDYLVGRKEY